jgi:hypothetical protein
MHVRQLGELGELQAPGTQLAELLAADDVGHLAAAMEPGSTAGVLIWENCGAVVALTLFTFAGISGRIAGRQTVTQSMKRMLEFRGGVGQRAGMTLTRRLAPPL